MRYRFLAPAAGLLLGIAAAAQAPRIPPPSGLDSMDAPVQEDYRQRRAALDALLAQAEPPAKDLARVVGQLGLWFHAYNYFAEAQSCYLEAAKLEPQEFRWPYYLAQTASRTGDSTAARGHFLRALELQPTDVPALAGLAEVELKEGRPEAAEPLLGRALQARPDCAQALLGLGRIALGRSDFAAAIRHLDAALALQPRASEIHYSLGLAHRGAGDLEKARAHLEQARGSNAKQVPVVLDDPLIRQVEELREGARKYQQQGQQAYLQGRFAEAAELFRKALEANPENLSARSNLGRALLQQGRPQEATEQARKILEAEPGNARAHLLLAQALERERKPAAAMEHYRAAVASNPRLATAHMGLGRLALQAARFDEALASFEKLAELDPGHADGPYLMSVAFANLGRYAEAKSAMERAHALAPERDDLMLVLARLLAAAPVDGLRDGRRALELAQSAFQKKKSIFGVQTLAMAQAELGNFEEALRWQTMALETAQKAGKPRIVERIQARMDLYTERKPCRIPFLPGEDPGPAGPR